MARNEPERKPRRGAFSWTRCRGIEGWGRLSVRFGALMLILLPPSEGKSREAAGPSLDLGELAFAEHLSEKRERLLDVLEKQATISRARAVAALGIPESQAEDVERNGELRRAATAPAAEIYTGVLYERLGFGSLSDAARRRAEKHLLIASALWGFVRPGDRIPYYRLSASAKLPRIKGLAAYWRPALREAMEAAEQDLKGQLVIDMRSGGYASAWRPRAASLYSVRPLTEYPDGTRKPVSHWAKATRGEVARTLLRARSTPGDAEAAAGILEKAGYRIELTGDSIDVIEAAPA